MTDTPDNIILVYLRRIDDKLDRLVDDVADLKRRVTSLEGQIGLLHSDFAGQSARLDRFDARLDRIEKRLNLVNA